MSAIGLEASKPVLRVAACRGAPAAATGSRLKKEFSLTQYISLSFGDTLFSVFCRMVSVILLYEGLLSDRVRLKVTIPAGWVCKPASKLADTVAKSVNSKQPGRDRGAIWRGDRLTLEVRYPTWSFSAG